MARKVFRLTPRATQALRAVEQSLRERLNEIWANEENQDDKPNFVINACDFRFSENSDFTIARFSELEVMYTPAGDTENFLWEVQYVGWVEMKKHVVPDGQNKRKNFVYYTVTQVVLGKCEKDAEAA